MDDPVSDAALVVRCGVVEVERLIGLHRLSAERAWCAYRQGKELLAAHAVGVAVSALGWGGAVLVACVVRARL